MNIIIKGSKCTTFQSHQHKLWPNNFNSFHIQLASCLVQAIKSFYFCSLLNSLFIKSFNLLQIISLFLPWQVLYNKQLYRGRSIKRNTFNMFQKKIKNLFENKVACFFPRHNLIFYCILYTLSLMGKKLTLKHWCFNWKH